MSFISSIPREDHMRTRTMVVTLTVAAALLVTGAAAQHEEHHKDQTSALADKMMSQMPRMTMEQNEAGKLVDQLIRSYAAIEAEKDPAALKEKLAEHGALLKELQTRVQGQSHMMEMMQHMMGGSMMG